MTAPAVAGHSVPVSPTPVALWRRARAVLLVGVIVVAAALVPALVSHPQPGRYADPADPSLDGSRALAALLTRHGVTVSRVDDAQEALAVAGPGTLILVTEASALNRAEAADLAAAPSDRLLVGPVPFLDLLAPGVTPKERGVWSRSRPPECALPEAVRAGSAYMGGTSFTAPAGATGCYPAPGGAPTLVRSTSGGRTVTVVGDGAYLTNLRLAEDGNAALALGLAGARPRVAWIVAPDEPDEVAEPGGPGAPDAPDAPDGDRTLSDLIPDAVPWAVAQLVVAVAVVALWRGRRLGPVVVERLPVVVRAAETVEGRGRLYRARQARDRAALALRAATAERLRTRLGLARGAPPEEVAAAAAARIGADPAHVRETLCGPVPPDDAALVALAGHLDTLERQVGHS
ncbi:DUF4350 domain-containing protein [Microbispora sp. RL4-1S]|uniref:DUF4350 domain-containing protein n=1 Tax=Microbispora oryzae TaxID=2806554 RepID=A0A940WLE0_9ACTN|nr:DUF4350 domain-containing protein [Microbispora oryzae]MBP2706022.1 DUF4350 domain-containing protein [Microbispora oryzae]